MPGPLQSSPQGLPQSSAQGPSSGAPLGPAYDALDDAGDTKPYGPLLGQHARPGQDALPARPQPRHGQDPQAAPQQAWHGEQPPPPGHQAWHGGEAPPSGPQTRHRQDPQPSGAQTGYGLDPQAPEAQTGYGQGSQAPEVQAGYGQDPQAAAGQAGYGQEAQAAGGVERREAPLLRRRPTRRRAAAQGQQPGQGSGPGFPGYGVPSPQGRAAQGGRHSHPDQQVWPPAQAPQAPEPPGMATQPLPAVGGSTPLYPGRRHAERATPVTEPGPPQEGSDRTSNPAYGQSDATYGQPDATYGQQDGPGGYPQQQEWPGGPQASASEQTMAPGQSYPASSPQPGMPQPGMPLPAAGAAGPGVAYPGQPGQPGSGQPAQAGHAAATAQQGGPGAQQSGPAGHQGGPGAGRAAAGKSRGRKVLIGVGAVLVSLLITGAQTYDGYGFYTVQTQDETKEIVVAAGRSGTVNKVEWTAAIKPMKMPAGNGGYGPEVTWLEVNVTKKVLDDSSATMTAFPRDMKLTDRAGRTWVVEVSTDAERPTERLEVGKTYRIPGGAIVPTKVADEVELLLRPSNYRADTPTEDLFKRDVVEKMPQDTEVLRFRRR
ncbi:hypothetical protein AB0J43_21195 [Nonomuraea fuscirosea]